VLTIDYSYADYKSSSMSIVMYTLYYYS